MSHGLINQDLEQHRGFVSRYPGSRTYTATCTCGVTLGRTFRSYQEAYGAIIEHEQENAEPDFDSFIPNDEGFYGPPTDHDDTSA